MNYSEIFRLLFLIGYQKIFKKLIIQGIFLLSDVSKVGIHVFILKVIVITLDLSSNSNPVSSKVLKSVVFDALGDILNKKLPIMVAVSYELAKRYAKLLNEGKVIYKAFVL